MTVIDDIKTSKGYILGVIGFTTALSGFLIEALGFEPVPTLLTTVGIASLVLYSGFLIARSEARQAEALKAHERTAEKQTESVVATLDNLKSMAEENRLDNLRIQLNQYIQYQPENHDTIIKIAERYFVEYHGNWVMTEEFTRWVTNENLAGRKVYIPENLVGIVAGQVIKEKKAQ